MSWELARLGREVPAVPTENEVLQAIRADPMSIMELAGLTPDPWQATLLRSTSTRTLLLCSRQSGKSTTSAALALRVAYSQPGSLVLLLSPSLRQSGELFRKVSELHGALKAPVPSTVETITRLELANGSRILCLPGDEQTVRGYSGVALLVIDEAARVPDELYMSVRPMLAVSGGQLICLSTPFGKRGFFHAEWAGPGEWDRIEIKATECPRITEKFLEEERVALGDRWFRQEYLCSFEDTVDSVFGWDDIEAACDNTLEPLAL